MGPPAGAPHPVGLYINFLGGYMKKISLLIVAAFCSVGLALVPVASHAVEAKVGLTMAYNWWKPAFLKMEHENAAKLFSGNIADNSDGTFMMGPMFWVNIASGWNMYGQVLFGLTRNQFEHSSIAADITMWNLLGGDTWNWYFDIGNSKVRRYDTDLGFEHALHKNINLLIGLRFNYADAEGNGFRFRFEFKDEDYSAWWLGPSLGLGFHWEIKDFSINPGISLLFHFGQYNLEKRVFGDRNFSFMLPYKYKVGYINIGFDLNCKFAYLIKKINLEVFIGLRYVFLPHIVVEDDGSIYDLTYKNKWINGELDHYGGLYWGAAYKF